MNKADLRSKETLTPPKKHWQKLILWGFQAIIAVLIVIFLLRRIELDLILATLEQISMPLFMMGLLFFASVFLVYGIQLKMLSSSSLLILPFFSLATLRFFFGAMIPASGDITYTLYGKSRNLFAFSTSVSTLIYSRFSIALADVVVAVVFAIIFTRLRWMWTVFALMLIPLILYSLVILFLHHPDLTKHIPYPRIKIIVDIRSRLLTWLEDYKIAQSSILFSSVLQSKVFVLSLLANGLSILWQWSAYQSLGLPITILQTGIIVLTLKLIGQIPISVLGGLGINSLSILTILGLLGLSSGDQAVSVSVTFQLVFYMYLGVVVVLAWLVLWVSSDVSKL